FLGFEDIVNMAEECRNPERDMPIAIYGTLAATTLLYLGVSVVALAAMPLDVLAASDAPIADAFHHATGLGARPIEIVAVVSVTNGALIQAIMAARVFYGLARRGQAPRWLGYVSPRTQTPVVGVWCATAAILALALAFPLAALARTSSLVILSVFVLVNLSAARLDRGWPRRIALLAALACAALLAADLARRIG
ncbi:MAG: amino acid permease, partial [Alphaproteobacteria bacterium]